MTQGLPDPFTDKLTDLVATAVDDLTVQAPQHPREVLCPICRNHWTPPTDADQQSLQWNWDEHVECSLKRAQITSGIRDRYLKARLTDFKIETQKLMEPLTKVNGFFWGEYGIGKTYLLSALATATIWDQRRPICFITWGDLVRKWRSCFHKKGERSEEEFMRDLASYRHLFLDDVSDDMDGQDSHALKVMFCDLYDRRYSEGRHTVLCSNLNLVQLGERFSQKLADRIRETVGERSEERKKFGLELKGVNRRVVFEGEMP